MTRVRIDRSDPADGSGDAHIARRARSTSDDPDAPGNNRGRAVTGDGAPNAYPARPNPALRKELTAAHRAVADAEYRQFDIDHGAARVDKLECEAFESLQVRGGDVPDDPRNYSNPKTGRFDASWSTYDRAIAAARERTGGTSVRTPAKCTITVLR